MQSPRQSSKTRTMNLVMQNPEFARALKEAWDAPFGSTKRERAKSVLSILKKTQPNFEREDVQNASTPSTNPWASLPAFVPTLNYAPGAPERGKKEPEADGQGGSGLNLFDAGKFDVPQSVPGPGLQIDPSGKVSMAQAAASSWNQSAPGFIGPQQRQSSYFSGMSEQMPSFSASNLYGQTTPVVSEVPPPAPPVPLTPTQQAAVDNPYFTLRGGDVRAGVTTMNTVPPFSLTAPPPTGFIPGLEPNKPVATQPTQPTASPTQKQILKGDGNTLYAWDGNSIRKIADVNTLQQLVRQGYVDTRAPLSQFYKPSSLSIGNSSSYPNMSVGKSVITGTSSSTSSQKSSGPTYQTGVDVYGPNDPYSAAYGSSSSSTYGSGVPGSGSTFTGGGSSYGALNRIPGLDINAPENQGLSMTEYESKALNILSKISDSEWSAAFPGQPKPFGADLVGHTQKLIDLKKSELGLDQMQRQLTQMVSENPTFALDARDYIVGQDQHLKKIDPLLEDARNQLANNSDFPLLRAMNQNYVNYLATMKGKAVQRYATYLNKAVDVRNAEVTRLQTDINNARQELSMAIPMIQAKSSQDYERIVKIIDENWQKPALAAQTEAQRLKDQRDSDKAALDMLKVQLDIEKLGGENNDDFLKAKKAIIDAVVDPYTKGWNPGVSDISDIIGKYAAAYPTAAYEAMKQIMTSSLRSPEKDSNGNSLPGLFNKQKMLQTYEQAISTHYADLTNQAAQLDTAFKNEQDPAQKQRYSDALGQVTHQISELAKVQMQVGAAVGERLAENFSNLDDKAVAEIRDFFVPKKWDPKITNPFNSTTQPADFSESRKQEFVTRFAPKLGNNQEVATWLFDTIKKNVEAGARLHGTNVLDARFYFDPKMTPSGEQIPAANKTNMSNDVLRYIMANFNVSSLMDHSSPLR